MLIDYRGVELDLRARMVRALRALDDDVVTSRLVRFVAYAPLAIDDERVAALDAEAVRVDTIWRDRVRRRAASAG